LRQKKSAEGRSAKKNKSQKGTKTYDINGRGFGDLDQNVAQHCHKKHAQNQKTIAERTRLGGGKAGTKS